MRSNDRIYHYTSVNGFYHIISENSIRMTMAEYMNDPSDCVFMIKLIKSFIKQDPKCKKLIDKFMSKPDHSGLYAEDRDLSSFVEYVLHRISICVMSLSTESDQMKMWNNYGNGGMELEFDRHQLMEALKQTISSDTEFLYCVDVVYLDERSVKLENFEIESLEELKYLYNVPPKKKLADIIEERENEIEKITSQKYDSDILQVYKTRSLGVLIRAFLAAYLHLLDTIGTVKNKDREVLFEEVYKELIHSTAPGYLWRMDVLLYLVAMSASIKRKTYEFEDECRIIYFDLESAAHANCVKKNFYLKPLDSGDLICPCVCFKSDSICDSLRRVIISPLTLNLPIDNDRYAEKLREFLYMHNYKRASVDFSVHEVRWR